MNIALILAGGSGSRVGSSIPKQFINVCEKPIIYWTIKNLDFSLFKNIVVVLHPQWENFFKTEAVKFFDYDNFLYAPAGNSRQQSIYNGLLVAKDIASDEDVVVIQDAARPCTSKELVRNIILGCKNVDGAMPVLPVKDTVYKSFDGKKISSIVNREEFFFGQAPEAFLFKKYFDINSSLSESDFSRIRGSSEIAFKNKLKINLIQGDERNFKVTTRQDIELLKFFLENGK